MGAIEVPSRPKLYSVNLQFSGQSISDLRKKVIDYNVEIDQSAEYGISGISTPTRFKELTTLVGVTLADLGLPAGASNQDVWKKAALRNLVAPPQETALELVCNTGANFSRATSTVVVMSHSIQSLAKQSDSILLGIVDKGTHRILVGAVGAPRWRVAPNMLLVFMQKQK